MDTGAVILGIVFVVFAFITVIGVASMKYDNEGLKRDNEKLKNEVERLKKRKYTKKESK